MIKMKTHKGAKKRVSVNSKGKFKRSHAFTSHILSKKTTKRKRKLRQAGFVSNSDMKRVSKLLPYV